MNKNTSAAPALYDNHMHSHFSGDSEAPMLEMVRAARSHQLKGITFTDHLDWDYYDEPHLFDLDFDAYQKAVQEIQCKENDADFEVLFGLEMGLQPHLAERHHALLQKYDFDYVIGSSHLVDGHDPYYPSYFRNLGLRDGLRRYFESILENLEAFHEYDAYGHLDYIIRYVGNAPQETFGSLSEEEAVRQAMSELDDLIDEILRTLIRYDIALEINTGAYRCGLSEPNPSLKIMRRYRGLGGQLITLGADAHKPEHVALGFTEKPEMFTGTSFTPIVELMKSSGFTEYAVYHKRKPVMIPLQ